ncbi:MAG TPA: IS110 family transposase [Thermoplasmata archaeon]|nr:IS110 family transposase [Thermoplasmata archaeon]
MENGLFVGLDVHKKSVVATVLDRAGNRIDQSNFGCRDSELTSYLEGLPGRKHVVLEACNVWEHFYDAAVAAGAEVTLAHPYPVRLISEASLKSDRVDSQSLADLLRLRGIPMAFAPDAEVRALRQLVRDRAFYKREEAGIKGHIYSALLRKGIPYDDGLLGQKRKREELRSYQIPEVDRGLDALTQFDKVTKTLDEEVHRAFLNSKEAQLLESIPGIGEFTALALVAELCPISRFPNVEKLCSYAGLVPTNHQSGESSYQGHLKTDSNHLVKWLMVEASWSHRQWAGKRSDVTKVARRVTRRGGKQEGNVAGAHKLLKIVYAVLKRGTPYTPDRPSSGVGPAES